jgi:ABC-2 type transport system ATP-binding protein
MSSTRSPQGESEMAISAHGLTKRFGKAVAVDAVDLSVRTGSVVGLLGPNGAGKTTIVRMLTTLLRPDAGSARVAGFDLATQPNEIRRSIGLTGQYAAVDELLTGEENLTMVGRLYHLPGDEVRRRGRDLLDQFDLTDAARRPAKTYSGGMRRRLDLAASLMARPPVIFLDEPTTGLDPRSRLGMWEVLDGLVRGGTTILLTTQYLDEADRLANDIVVIDHGRIVASGTPDSLKRQVGGEAIDLVLSDPGRVVGVSDLLRNRLGLDVTQSGDRTGGLSLTAPDGSGTLVQVIRALDEQGVAIADIGLRRPTLDDVFLRLTGQSTERTEEAA